MSPINWYFAIYTGFVLIYLWLRFSMFVLGKEPEYKDYPSFMSVIVPCFNEEPKLLKKCINSLIESDGKKEIIVIDDGSKNEDTLKMLKTFEKFVKVLYLKNNLGKRHAQYEGFKIMRGDVMVTIDSDTIIEKNALTELIKPFNDDNIGAIAGNVRVLNKNVNWLTKTIDARYRNAFEFERESQSSFGNVNCCSGVLSAYRTQLLKRVLKKYVFQKFLNEKCNFGDDRHLTNLILSMGYKVVFRKKSIAYTEAPTTIKEYIVQQIRWKQSFIRESLISMKFMSQKGFLFTLETLMIAIYPLFGLIVRLSIFIVPLFFPLMLIYYFVIINLMAIIINLNFIPEWEPFKFSIFYAWIHIFIIYWLYFIALYKVFVQRTTAWGTR